MSTFKDHFSQLAAQYAAFRPTYPAALFDYLAALCPRRERAWDCACGNGQATLALAEHFESVTGTDASEQQVAAAAAHPKVTYRCATAEHSGLPSGCFDLVTVAQALHWFDLDGFYREVRRVLRPEGIIAAWTYGIVHVEGDGLDSLVQQYYHDVVGPYWPAERRLVEEGYRQLSFPFDELRNPPFEMEERWSLARLLGYTRTWSATKRYVDRNSEDPVVALESRLLSLWGDPVVERRVSWPLGLRVGRLAASHRA